jgi:hypothetical protein
MARTLVLGLIVVAFGSAASLAAPDPVPNLVGVYDCAGVNPDGTKYQGLVEIAKVENTYRVLWVLEDNSAVMGVGIFSGGVFAVSYFGGSPAIIVYKIDGDRLVGEWTMGGREGTMYSETLTKSSAERPPLRRVPADHPLPQSVRPV